MGETLPAEKWLEVKNAYELGKGSLRELGLLFNIPLKTVESHCIKEKWEKGKLLKLLERKTAELFVEEGLPPREKVKIMVDAIQNAKVTKYNAMGEKVEILIDRKTILEYIKEQNKMVGDYAPEKKIVDSTQRILNININPVKARPRPKVDITKESNIE